MKPIIECWNEFKNQTVTRDTESRMRQWLELNYPQVLWDVTVISGREINVKITPTFKTEKDKTFYYLQWI